MRGFHNKELLAAESAALHYDFYINANKLGYTLSISSRPDRVTGSSFTAYFAYRKIAKLNWTARLNRNRFQAVYPTCFPSPDRIKKNTPNSHSVRVFHILSHPLLTARIFV
jgi:hypothetical protein